MRGSKAKRLAREGRPAPRAVVDEAGGTAPAVEKAAAAAASRAIVEVGQRFAKADPGAGALKVCEVRHRVAGRSAAWILVASGAMPAPSALGSVERILVDRLRRLEEDLRHGEAETWARVLVERLIAGLERDGLLAPISSIPPPRVGAVVLGLREVAAVALERSSIVAPGGGTR